MAKQKEQQKLLRSFNLALSACLEAGVELDSLGQAFAAAIYQHGKWTGLVAYEKTVKSSLPTLYKAATAGK